MTTNFNSSKTKVNLMRAFAGESQARNRYDFAADKAKKMGCYFLYNIFTLTANQEKAHAKVFYDHLKQANGENIEVDCAKYPVDNFETIEELLKAAAHNEKEEFSVVYPSFAKTAREEGFPEIAFSFEKIADIEKEHHKRFNCFYELLQKSKMFESDEEIEWICLHCGHIQKGKKAPKQCPVCSHPEGFFVPYKFYNFIANSYTKPCENCEGC